MEGFPRPAHWRVRMRGGHPSWSCLDISRDAAWTVRAKTQRSFTCGKSKREVARTQHGMPGVLLHRET